MNTSDVEDTIERLESMISVGDVGRARRQLASAITAIVSQRLMNRADDHGLVPAVEVMVNTGRATEALRGEKNIRLRDAIADGAYFGMESFDQSLLRLQQKGLVSFQDALTNASDPADFKVAVQALGLRSA